VALVGLLAGRALVGRRQLLHAGLHAPDVARVLGDRPVAAELAAAGDVVQRHARPPVLVLCEVDLTPTPLSWPDYTEGTRRGIEKRISNMESTLESTKESDI